MPKEPRITGVEGGDLLGMRSGPCRSLGTRLASAPLNDSINALSVGSPRRLKSGVT